MKESLTVDVFSSLWQMFRVSAAGDDPVSSELPSIDQLKQNALVLHPITSRTVAA